MKSTITAALVGALVSGTAMYTVGAWTSDQDPAAAASPAAVETFTPATQTALRPAAVVNTQPQVRRVSSASATQTRVVETKPRRSWKKSALVIGGSAASGAGIGGAIGGKKGALTGLAIGGGAASIYEAIRHD